jgi:hypothetical protein
MSRIAHEYPEDYEERIESWFADHRTGNTQEIEKGK